MLTARTVPGIAEVEADAWDACAGAANPFVRHAFLRALEDSGSVGPGTGWAPMHVALEDGDGALVACAPAYLKGHSQGEYVFDHGWAEAFMRAGGAYYPKLQVAVPFSPVTGPRLLVRPDAPDGAADALVQALTAVTERADVSSLHVTFPTEAEWSRMARLGFLPRTGEQFRWSNAGYRDFGDFLDALSARKRKAIRRERRDALEGVEIERLEGGAIGEPEWEAMYGFYMDTGSRKWGRPYLTRAFFHLLGGAAEVRPLLVLARAGGAPVAGALHLVGADTLYGRYWGCAESRPFLHFELCYYQAIEYAIERGLRHVEAGAQGPHKVQRGYLPVRTFSAHWIRHPGLRDAVARYLDGEREAVECEIAAIRGTMSPYRAEGPRGP